VNKLPTALWDDPHIEARWGKKAGFMSDMRARGKGPKFLRLSARTVRYRAEDVLAYEAAQEFGNIAESLTSDFTAPPALDDEKPERHRRFLAVTETSKRI
jgi:hypothetical protein